MWETYNYKMNHKGKIAIFQISILIFGFVAVACLVGNIPTVSAWWSAVVSTVEAGISWVGGLFSGGGPAAASTSALKTFGYALMWAAATYFAIQWIGGELDWGQAETDAISAGAAAGVAVYYVMQAYASTAASAGPAGWITMAVVAIVVWATRKNYSVVSFSCYAWNAPEGGDNCELCNHQILPCDEYQCRSLGRSCQLANPGTENELCVANNINDIIYPEIQPWEDVLDEGFIYTLDQTIPLPGRGVQLVYEKSSDGCAPAFTPLKFGVTLDKPGKCKIDTLRKSSFENMSLYLSAGMDNYNHTVQYSLPGAANLAQEDLELENDGNFELYVRCQNLNGYSNLANFVFKYCIDQEPDVTAPDIRSTSIVNNMPVAKGQDSIEIIFYINEPAECKWSHDDKIYDDMQNEMICANSLAESIEVKSELVYPCVTNLTGIQDGQDNKFYIKCRDQPLLKMTDRERDRNTHTTPYEYTLIGTRELILEEAGPNEEVVKDSSESVKVTLTAKTSAGFREGEAMCYYSEKGEDNYIMFFNTFSNTHSTDLYLEKGEYEFDIKCVDIGGNADTTTITFEAESDTSPPKIVRVYKENNNLKIVTDEPAVCVYNPDGCNYLFGEGITLTTSKEKIHSIRWSDQRKYHIKCRDEYGNEPAQSKCSSIIRTID